MKKPKIKTPYPGVRYYEHSTRKQRNGQPDRYYSIRYKKDGRTIEEGMGWATEQWNAEKAFKVLSGIKENKKTGAGPQSLSEMRKKAAAERAAAEKEASEEYVTNMPFQDFFERYYMPEAKRSKRSWLTDEQRYHKIIKPAIGAKPLPAITREDIQGIIDSLVESGAAPSTIKQYRSIINYTFTQASLTKLQGATIFGGQNPVRGVKIPPIKNARERFLTAKEVKSLINAAKKLPYIDLHDCIVLSLNTGLRLGELQRLEWPDVDMAHAMLTVRDEAHRKPGGKVPLNDAALGIFKERWKQQKKRIATGLVFPPIVGGNMRASLTHAFRALVDSVGLNDGIRPDDRARRIVFHSLRHTFASWLACNGEDIYRIQRLMRHRTITMTMRYAHLIPDATRSAVHNLKPPKAL
ncbi:MAG: tyrosine-type recombinase/integrase [Desulfovibrio piger]|uniref:tyrosine-type recombinase/integrase n=1 Tax=Desulfovibrio piger TaxID=901 RepID=UPI0022E0DC95